MAVQINGDEVDQNLYMDLVPLLPSEVWHNNPHHPNHPFPQNPPSFMVEDSPDPVLHPPSNLTNINPALLFHPSLHHLAGSYSPSQIMNSAPSLSSPLPLVGMIPEPDDIAPLSHNRRRDPVRETDIDLNPQRDTPPELQPTVLVSVDNWVSNGCRHLGGNPQGDNPPGCQPTILVSVDDLVHNGSQTSRASGRDILEENPRLRFLRIIEANRSNIATGMGARTGSHHPDTNPDTLMSNILALQAARREKLKNEKESNGTTHSEKKNDEGCKCCGGFECNICFETSVDPVVTQCGHLFCWRCLYKWTRMQFLGSSECPVCKGEVTDINVTPIYGRGGSSSTPDPVPGDVVEEIPPRPSGRRTDSTRQLMRRERETNGRGFGSQYVQRVRTDLEAVLARLRQMPRPNRATSIDVASDAAEAFAGTMRRIRSFPRPFEGEDPMEVGGRGEVRGEGDGPESEVGSSVAGEVHVRRRRRYR